MMDERVRLQSPAERDRVLQRFLAEAQTPSERFRTLGILMNFLIALRRNPRERDHG